MSCFILKITLLTCHLQSYIRQWNNFLLKQIDAKRIHPGILKPVQHYISHIVYMVKQQGVLRAYSARSMERSIGKYKKLIKSKVNAGANAGNILERLTTRNHINSQSWSVHNELDLLTPRSYAEKSFKNNPSGEANDPQLWEPFQNCLVISLPVGVDSRLFSKALLKYYRRTEPNGASIVGIASLDSLYIAGRAWAYNNVYTSTLYKDHISEHRRGNNYIMFTASYV
jgi:hypothetical protein